MFCGVKPLVPWVRREINNNICRADQPGVVRDVRRSVRQCGERDCQRHPVQCQWGEQLRHQVRLTPPQPSPPLLLSYQILDIEITPSPPLTLVSTVIFPLGVPPPHHRGKSGHYPTPLPLIISQLTINLTNLLTKVLL